MSSYTDDSKKNPNRKRKLLARNRVDALNVLSGNLEHLVMSNDAEEPFCLSVYHSKSGVVILEQSQTDSEVSRLEGFPFKVLMLFDYQGVEHERSFEVTRMLRKSEAIKASETFVGTVVEEKKAQELFSKEFPEQRQN